MIRLDPPVFRKSILIVEDDPVIISLIELMIKNLGYNVAGSASTAQEAIDATKKLDPDLVLMDIHLDGQSDGIEAASTIWGFYGKPVVFITADTEDKTFQRAMKTSPFGYIEKPFNKKWVMLTLKMAFYRYEEEKIRSDMNFRNVKIDNRDI